MKTNLLTPLIVAALVAAPVCAFAQEPDPPLHKTATVDVNGDGKPDTVSLAVKAEANQFTLSINSARITASYEDTYNNIPGFQVLKLNGNSKVRYLAVLLSGESDLRETRLYLYNGKMIRPAGVVPDAITAPTGIVYAQWWMGFWQCKGKFAPGANGVVKIVPQAAYFVGKSGKASNTFIIRSAPTATAPLVANVAPGSTVELLLFKPLGAAPDDPEKGYYLIKTVSGLCGWVDYKDMKGKLPDLPWAG